MSQAWISNLALFRSNFVFSEVLFPIFKGGTRKLAVSGAGHKLEDALWLVPSLDLDKPSLKSSKPGVGQTRQL
jgi:hypothetical protein